VSKSGKLSFPYCYPFAGYAFACVADIQFERDWQNAISGDELVKRVHHHIDQLYANPKP
jgi:hypothetical protein